jgi:hypothetical protein
MKDLMSVLPAVDCLNGEPGHATPFNVQPCSVRTVYLKELVSVLPAGDGLHGDQASSPITAQPSMHSIEHYLMGYL